MNSVFRRRLLRGILLALCALCGAVLICCPVPAMEAVREALRLCRDTIIPSLFPFLVISALLTALLPRRFLRRWLSPVTEPLFHLSGTAAAVLVLGFTGGYPVGIRTTSALYRTGRISRAEALRLAAFSNNSGPGFLLGVVGVGVFGSTAAGLCLYLIHVASALLVGLLFRFYDDDRHFPADSAPPVENRPLFLSRTFTDAVTGSFLSLLNICAFVLFFMIVLRMLAFTGLLHLLASALAVLLSPLGLTEYSTAALLAGILEVSTGSACLQGLALTPGSAALASFLLGWGGLSVHCQSLTFLWEAGLPCGTYFAGKTCQAFFSAALAFLLFSLLFP